MIDGELIQDLNDRPSEELRQVIAYCAGICAHRDGDGGLLISEALYRVADRLSGKPRRAAA